MDGLNESWEKYGCNEHDAIISMAYNASSGGLTYWVNSNDVKYAAFTIASSSALVGDFNSGSVGVIYVLYPDRTFKRTESPGFLGAEYPFYYDLLDEGGCLPHRCDDVDIDMSLNNTNKVLNDNFKFNGNYLEKISLSNSGKVEVKIIDVKGTEIKTLVNSFKSAGEHNVNFNFNNLSNGAYFISLKVNNNLSTEKIIISK